ncbi:heme biosynthesis protein HemY [Agitococcus lubricus]|uniref:HemY protein n=1 Tax=Agitococcus lubricus TaxID=1077255 RepID=A0A2T5J394_9GAMM|nr:heme biosynthesis HemY N-terminal domain-containing protein [Agitococcus lubricus]PTQ91071.1 HemY protein [Agitococcus lubricus]
MTRLLLLLFSLLLGGGLALLFLADNGYVLIAWQQSSIEMSLALALLLMLLSVLILFSAIELLLGVFGVRILLRKWLQRRRYQQAQQHFHKGLYWSSLAEYKQAEKAFARSAEFASEGLAAYLAAADAAQQQGAIQRAEDYLQRADIPAHRIPVQMARIRLWMATGQWEVAASSLKLFYQHDRKQTIIAELLIEVLVKLQAWPDLIELLPLLTKTLAYQESPASLNDAYQRSMQWLVQTGSRVDKVATLKRLRDFWATIPNFAQQNIEIILSYAQAVVAIGFDEEAEDLIRSTLDQEWHNGLVELYGRLRYSQPEQSLAKAKEWLKKRPQNPVLLLTLGRLSMQNRLWDDAKAYFEQSLTLHKNTETYAEFVRLLQHLNDPEANHYLIAGLNQLISKPLPNLPLP